ncbi:ring-cleaving dioxygenase [Cohnella sp. 56]|uniref:ring-cleaving dioxygenase n=1 Tax=Cohnella sp. 56 TaxID=3113722 RepID=UPI0030EA46EA
MKLKGIHHVSAITGTAAGNVDFYTKVLGMRLVKKTVNQDDTSVYHLFYGDERGNPGTELTFFEFPNAWRSRPGTSSISSVSLRVPGDAALNYWHHRFVQYEVDHDDITERAGRLTLAFRDPEGQRLMLVSDEHDTGIAGGKPWVKADVPAEYGIVGLGPVQLTVSRAERTERVLTQLMGYTKKGQYASAIAGQPDIVVYETGEGGSGTEIHLEERSDLPQERQGIGAVHHVAFRVDDEAELRAWIDRVGAAGLAHSGFVDRFYFKSLYFREASGILFELATDGPGFDTDESLDALGESLALPPFLEPHRARIEAGLRPIGTGSPS